MAPIAVLGTLGVLAAALLASRPDRPARWPDGSTHGPWRAVFDGHGQTTGDTDTIVLRPRPPGGAAETHASLVVSRDYYHDVRFQVRVRTESRLRRPAPNPWEVGWVVWNYTDDQHFYYLTLKPNGWELGKRDPAYPGGQRFLATGAPAFPPGRWYAVDVAQRGATMTISVNGRRLTSQTDQERPYAYGAVGFYTEDAQARFRAFSARSG